VEVYKRECSWTRVSADHAHHTRCSRRWRRLLMVKHRFYLYPPLAANTSLRDMVYNKKPVLRQACTILSTSLAVMGLSARIVSEASRAFLQSIVGAAPAPGWPYCASAKAQLECRVRFTAAFHMSSICLLESSSPVASTAPSHSSGTTRVKSSCAASSPSRTVDQRMP
jgi:hypothetical protein